MHGLGNHDAPNIPHASVVEGAELVEQAGGEAPAFAAVEKERQDKHHLDLAFDRGLHTLGGRKRSRAARRMRAMRCRSVP